MQPLEGIEIRTATRTDAGEILTRVSMCTDWYIGRLGVVSDLQGRRLGRRLLTSVESCAPEDAARFTLTTGPKSVENIAFYERHGYRRVPGDDELVYLVEPRCLHRNIRTDALYWRHDWFGSEHC